MTRLADHCESDPCLNGGKCWPTSDGFFCDCPTHPQAYTGPDCGQLYNACNVYKCPNAHECLGQPGFPDYQCLCHYETHCKGCEPNSCALPNSQCSGTADIIRCQCQDGYSGTDCQYNATVCTPNPCQNNASCVVHSRGYSCVCEPGWTGQHCETDVNECLSNPCKNKAICMDKVNKYLCFCVPGFQGYNCEIDINECASRPCLNNASCMNLMDQYMCDCGVGYTGDNCETEIDECESNPCHNGATCRDHIGYFSCDCPAGYEGKRCQFDIDECQSQPCQNGGHCQDAINRYECNCTDTGFVGDQCEIDIPECASNPCWNNGSCLEGVKSFSCLCWPGYSGDQCATDDDECSSQPCDNGALCLERSNQSNYWTEPEFDTDFSYSSAVGYVCRCQPGFTGENCSININECESMPCHNGGSCIDLVNEFRCDCTLGFTGVACSINIDDCENNPCENGATCQDEVAGYRCLCPETTADGITWGGNNCSVKLEGCLEHNCQNQAKCIPTYDEEVHRYICICQPGFYGDNCSITTTFSFSSSGYILHDLSGNNRSRKSVEESVSVSLRFRTTLSGMVLVYRGDGENFLLLEVYKGLLHVGIGQNGSSIRSAIDAHRVDDGHWYQAEVFLNKFNVFLHLVDCIKDPCNISTFLDTDYSLHLQKSFSMIYIGGLPAGILSNNLQSQQNFTGCMEDLKIDSRMLLPQNIDPDIVFNMELGCNKTDWCHPNPCEHESPCIDLWTEFRCECNRPYTGPTCMLEYTPSTFHWEGTPSFASFLVPQNFGDTFNISGFIRTLKADGLLVQISNQTVDYFSAYLHNGKLRVSTLSANPLVFLVNLNDGKKHMINLSVRHGQVTVTHLQKELVLGQLPPVSVTDGDIIHVGGIPPGGSSEKWGGYFKGCLQDLRLNNHRLEFFPPKTGAEETIYSQVTRNVTQGCVSDDVCESSPCRNNGTCSVTWNDYVCSCPANFTGRMCEELVWCERRPCPAETTCQDVPDGYVCLTSATFLGNSSVTFTPNISASQDITSISLEFRTREQDALLLKASKDGDSIHIAVEEEFLVIALHSGNSVEGIRYKSTTKVSNALLHRVVMTTQESSRWVVQLNNLPIVTLQGSSKNLNFLGEEISIVLAVNYTGCLGRVAIGGIYLPFTDHSYPQPEQFIRSSSGSLDLGCRGADVCSMSPCLHGGKCVDHFNDFRCECRNGWEGLLCQLNIDDCNPNPCISGSCTDLEANYQCDCFPGYTGINCETNVDDCTHHRCLNGGLCVDGVNSYTCKCLSSYTGPYCQWPFPPDQCDRNFSCLNGGQCMSGIWGANCTCRAGFTGKRCEININDCESNPCLNGGTCQDSVNTFKCICNSSFSGVRCEKSSMTSIFPFPLLGVAVPVTSGILLLLVIAAILMALTARKRRQSEGTYSPSQQEVAGARLEMDSVLKVPPEERLI
ncbi:protein crumbs homolog 2 [Bombina bombina]|uniref:protein crumbs homolog 2 n=1 Tax=Bombina bombina TaxID=8345 RepID=UPI00235B08E1|nr:protein crumbs homolog 2 [Bombina bombina]